MTENTLPQELVWCKMLMQGNFETAPVALPRKVPEIGSSFPGEKPMVFAEKVLFTPNQKQAALEMWLVRMGLLYITEKKYEKPVSRSENRNRLFLSVRKLIKPIRSERGQKTF